MAGIEQISRPVYLAKTKRRCYLSPRSAANAEARALIAAKYPSEKPDYDDEGRCTYPGYHWSSDDQLNRLHSRLVRIIVSKFKRAAKGASEGAKP
jgi:hypothetical protein